MAAIDPATTRRLTTVGLGVLGAGFALGGLVWFLERQLSEGRLIKVTLRHELDPGTQSLLNQYRPLVERISERGLDHNIRMFRRRGGESEPASPALLDALAPGGGAANRYPGYLY
jgi:hypothetical protein